MDAQIESGILSSHNRGGPLNVTNMLAAVTVMVNSLAMTQPGRRGKRSGRTYLQYGENPCPSTFKPHIRDFWTCQCPEGKSSYVSKRPTSHWRGAYIVIQRGIAIALKSKKEVAPSTKHYRRQQESRVVNVWEIPPGAPNALLAPAFQAANTSAVKLI